MAKAVFYELALTSGLAGALQLSMIGKGAPKGATYGPKFLPPDVVLRTYEQNRLFYETIGRAAKGGPGAEKGETAKASIWLISGCQDNQLSYDGAINSVFTAALLLVWDGGKFKGDYGDFHIQIQSKMLPTQSPNHFKVGKQDLVYDLQKPFTI